MRILVMALTALALLDVVLTRRRLAGRRGAGHHAVGPVLLGVHTGVGLLTIVGWTAFLVAPGDSLLGGPGAGVLALAGWWIVTLAGLLILLRWLPSKGRHSSEGTDTWSQGPWLSVLAHVGMLVGAIVFTYAYLQGSV